MDKYEIFKELIIEHPDKAKILRVLSLCDDPTISVVTRYNLSKKIRMSPNALEQILYLLSALNMLRIEKVGRIAIYFVTVAYGGRLLDELRQIIPS